MRKCSRCHRKKEDDEFSSPKTCKVCSDKKKALHGGKGHGSSQEWKDENRERLRVYNRGWRTGVKAKVVIHYGGKCECCGVDDIRFLTIDHIKGNGCAHRSAIGIRPGPPFYRWLIAQGFPEGYTVLCFNCNCGRSVNGGVCPHKMELLSVA